MMKLDDAVVSLLGLDPAKTKVESHGGGGSSSARTSKITTTLATGEQRMYFMKTGLRSEASVMFEGEHASLHAIHSAVPSLCPESYGHGTFRSNSEMHFLVTDFLDLSGRASRRRSSGPASPRPGADFQSAAKPLSLARKLAKLHSTPAPVPQGLNHPQFGFPATTCCGDTPQSNQPYTTSWATFFSTNRLKFILTRSERANGPDAELSNLIKQVCDRVVPRLIGDRHLNNGEGVMPVVVHGDLWSGNAARGIISNLGAERGGSQEAEDVVYDPSACYAHSEYDLGIMRMFGGFGPAVMKEYHDLVPKTEPVEEYEDRVKLYESYHHLNHYALFGGGYRGGAISILKALVRKYGG